MKHLTIYFTFISFLINLFKSSIVVEENELYEIHSIGYVQFDLVENKNNYNYLFVQVILCHSLPTGSHLIIQNESGEKIFNTDIISGRNFYVDIRDQIGKNLTINATSSDMYVQYQYVNEDKGIILASGSIKDYNFGNDYISFELSPVVNNTETTYDLYYLGKTNVYNDICQKVAFILENSPISTITFKGNDNFDLKFENIQFKTGYYLIKGNNVNDIGYYYFYERINVVNRLGPFQTNEVEFFEVKSESNEYYSIFTTPGNPGKKKYLNLQIVLCDSSIEQKSHISILDENNVEIFFTDVIGGRQVNIDIGSRINITMLATSPRMYLQYQFTDSYIYVFSVPKINSYRSKLSDRYLTFNITPVERGASTFYELYYTKNQSLISDECKKIEYILKNDPISSVNAVGKEYNQLKFEYDISGDGDEEKGFVFIKANNVNETNYTIFYDNVNTTIRYTDDSISTLLMALVYVVIAACGIAVIIVIIILITQGMCKREKDEEKPPGSISLINRNTEKMK